MSWLSIFDPQQRTIKRYQQVVTVINDWEPQLKKLTDAKLRDKTVQFRQRLAKGESLEKILPEAYAVVREAARRQIGKRHYDVQLIAGIAFHEGKIAEQRTGEGKTLSATLPLYLNALEGKGAHLVTVNDYLSQIGAGWMGPIYHALGLKVGVIVHDASFLYDPDFTGEERGDERLEHFRPIPRREAYAADITYGTNNEFGFDYLRDNMAQRRTDQVQRQHHFAIVDEADSILIDEARTPLIISAPDAEPTEKYLQFAKLVRLLTPQADYIVDEKMRTATLTDLGIKRLERQLGVTNLYEESFDTIHHAEQALKAYAVFDRDKDYVVREGEIIIVDEHTGRLMFGRRYSDGLHQAIEAKEEVKVQQESRTLATISLQNYFRLYQKLAGMSGTAVTEAEEFQQIYQADVVSIPTNQSICRNDFPDVIYKTLRAKYTAIVQEIESVHQTGRPILLGTRSIEQNQIIAKFLQRKNIPHQVLNAKNHEREAFIIAEAGKPGAITVATNIAGRGVDIVLGGAEPEKRDYDSKQKYEQALRHWQKAHDEVVAAGGLHIVGTERHEARRIDNQLRGRAGRQGDPGSSRFFVSLEDEIMRIFGGDQISRLMDALHLDENTPIEHQLITKAITQAQIKVEGFFFDQRKNLVEYDDVMNRQREVIYQRRQRLLDLIAQEETPDRPAELKQRLAETFTTHFQNFVDSRLSGGLDETEQQNLLTELSQIIPFDSASLDALKQQLARFTGTAEIVTFLEKIYVDTYRLREDSLGTTTMREIELFVFLSAIDEQWMNHLDNMTTLRDSIWLRGGKEQALAEYKKEAFQLFTAMIARIETEALKRIFRVQVQGPVQPIAPTKLQTSGPSENTAALAQALNSLQTGGTSIESTSAEITSATQTKPSRRKKKQRTKGSYL